MPTKFNFNLLNFVKPQTAVARDTRAQFKKETSKTLSQTRGIVNQSGFRNIRPFDFLLFRRK